MARGDFFRFDEQGLIDLSNEVLDSVCMPDARRVADLARSPAPRDSGEYAESFRVVRDPRTSMKDWAHAYVVTDAPHAGAVESRTGNLARALNGA